MPFALLLAVVLAAETPEEEHPNRVENEHAKLIALAAGAVLIGGGTAIGSWVDREGTFGRVSAITAGTLSTALVSASLGAFIASSIFLSRAHAKSVLELVTDIIDYSVTVALTSIISGFVGLGVGALASGFATAPPGTPRGVFGITSGSVLAVTGISVLLVGW